MSADREKLLDLIVRWEEARARGLDPSPEAICRDCPDLLEEFRFQIEKLDQVDWLNDPIGGSTVLTRGAPTAELAFGLPRMMAGRYRLDALIGEGGFGRVYRSFDTWLERPVALKIPRVDRSVTGNEVDLCRLEARKVARLRHPNIVPVHDVGRDGETCFIVSEWIDGENLAVWIQRQPLSAREGARIVAEIAGALAHAHQRGFVHRDIKPANIVLDGRGQAFLTDFGIAEIEGDLLRNVRPAGTFPYMAPEQFIEGLGPVDHRADLYSLGVVLYEMLAGRRPFLAGTPNELREQILGQEPPSPGSPGGRVPEELDRICLRCLARRPEERYPSAEQLESELWGYLGT
jgi:serine/threonine protein kinase